MATSPNGGSPAALEIDIDVARRCRIVGAESQAVFDVLLRCLAEPGSIRQLPEACLAVPVSPCAWLPLALADVGIRASVPDDPALEHLLHRVVGVDITPATDAEFVVLPEIARGRLEGLRTGSALAPELGARVAVAVEQLSSSPDGGPGGRTLRLTGPGVDGSRTLTVVGLPDDAETNLGRRADHPAGLDVWLVTPTGDVVGVPRTTHIEWDERENH